MAYEVSPSLLPMLQPMLPTTDIKAELTALDQLNSQIDADYRKLEPIYTGAQGDIAAFDKERQRISEEEEQADKSNWAEKGATILNAIAGLTDTFSGNKHRRMRAGEEFAAAQAGVQAFHQKRRANIMEKLKLQAQQARDTLTSKQAMTELELQKGQGRIAADNAAYNRKVGEFSLKNAADAQAFDRFAKLSGLRLEERKVAADEKLTDARVKAADREGKQRSTKEIEEERMWANFRNFRTAHPELRGDALINAFWEEHPEYKGQLGAPDQVPDPTGALAEKLATYENEYFKELMKTIPDESKSDATVIDKARQQSRDMARSRLKDDMTYINSLYHPEGEMQGPGAADAPSRPSGKAYDTPQLFEGIPNDLLGYIDLDEILLANPQAAIRMGEANRSAQRSRERTKTAIQRARQYRAGSREVW